MLSSLIRKYNALKDLVEQTMRSQDLIIMDHIIVNNSVNAVQTMQVSSLFTSMIFVATPALDPLMTAAPS